MGAFSLPLALLWGLLSGLTSSTAAAEVEPLSVTSTTFWPNPVDKRDASVTFTYSAPTDATYALYVAGRDSDLAYEHKQPLGNLSVGATGTWTWDGLDRDGVPLPRDTYNVWLLQSDGTDYIEYWPEAARIPISLHNSTERLVVDDHATASRSRSTSSSCRTAHWRSAPASTWTEAQNGRSRFRPASTAPACPVVTTPPPLGSPAAASRRTCSIPAPSPETLRQRRSSAAG